MKDSNDPNGNQTCDLPPYRSDSTNFTTTSPLENISVKGSVPRAACPWGVVLIIICHDITQLVIEVEQTNE
jgi:hypothetical protein